MRDCFEQTAEFFRDVETRVYLESDGATALAKRAKDLSEGVKASAADILRENRWLSETARQRFLQKIDNIGLNAGYPKWIFNNSELNRRYKPKLLDGKKPYLNYFHHWVQLSKWDARVLYGPVDRTQFAENNHPTATGNAKFDSWRNAVSLPAGDFEKPLFEDGYPDSFIFGCLGQVTGHEIFHAFDAHAVYDDDKGNMRYFEQPDAPWLLADSKLEFEQRVRCLVDDVNKYCFYLPLTSSRSVCESAGTSKRSLPDLPSKAELASSRSRRSEYGFVKLCVNGSLTLDEDMADLNGIRAAWRAYDKLMASSRDVKRDVRLPGLEQFSADQLFFIGASQFYCDANNPLRTYKSITLNLDPHSPYEARVNQMARHFPQFAETFGCPRGSPMVAASVCSIY